MLNFFNWLRASSPRVRRKRLQRYRPAVEALETRQLLASVVANLTAHKVLPPSAVEGQPIVPTVVLHFNDATLGLQPSDFSASVQTGDGMTLTSTANPENVSVVTDPTSGFDVVFANYTYPRELSGGRFAVSVTDINGATVTRSRTLNVADAPLTAGTLSPPLAAEGQQLDRTVVFHFADENPLATAADFTAKVSLGNGTKLSSRTNPQNVQVVANPNGGFDVLLTYTYAHDLKGARFAVSVKDRGGRSTKASSNNFAVADAPLTAGSLNPPLAFKGWGFTHVVVFHFADANPLATPQDFAVEVKTGDGRTLTNSANPGNVRLVANPLGGFDVLLSYRYRRELTNATFAVSVHDHGQDIGASATFSVMDSSANPLIKDTWAKSGGPRSFLGAPTSDQTVDSIFHWQRMDFEHGSIFLVPEDPNGFKAVALGSAARHIWLDPYQSLDLTDPGQEVRDGPLGDLAVPPSWAAPFVGSMTTLGTQPTTGGHNGYVTFFARGLIYMRDGLTEGVTMIYDKSPGMGNDTYARFKLQLLDEFTDQYGHVLVDFQTPANFTAFDSKHAIADNIGDSNQNDSAWMTGQALATFAMERDFVTTEYLLASILKNEWPDGPSGNPIRHPIAFAKGKTNFVIDAFTTQVAGSYFAWKYANEAGNQMVQDSARQLIDNFIDLLIRCNSKLGTDSGSSVIHLNSLIVLDQVAREMEIDRGRLDGLSRLIATQKADFVSKADISQMVAGFLATGPTVPPSAVSHGPNELFLTLDDTTIWAIVAAVEGGFDTKHLNIPAWMRAAWGDGKDKPFDPYDASAMNLIFWDAVVMHDIAPTWMTNQLITLLATRSASYDMLPFQVLTGSPQGTAKAQSF